MPVMGGDRSDAGLVVALLGPVEVGPAGGVISPVAQPRLRVLLGLLGVVDGRVVTAEALVDGLWGEEWSPGRERNLHALVYQLRRRLAALEPGKGVQPSQCLRTARHQQVSRCVTTLERGFRPTPSEGIDQSR
jgi:DNA-binding SARP family transcriptional activator